MIGADFIGDEPVALMLGDNIFHGVGLGRQLRECADAGRRADLRLPGGQPRGVRRGRVRRRRHGALDRGETRKAQVTVRGAGALLLRQPGGGDRPVAAGPAAGASWRSPRSTRPTCDRGELHVTVLDRGTAWLDTGTFGSMVQAAEFVRVIEERQGFKIGCIEEVAWRAGFIADAELRALAEPLTKSGYGDYLLGLLESGSVFCEAAGTGHFGRLGDRAGPARRPARAVPGVVPPRPVPGRDRPPAAAGAGQPVGVGARDASAASTSPTCRPGRPNTSRASGAPCSTWSSTSGWARRHSAGGRRCASTTSTAGHSTCPRGWGTPFCALTDDATLLYLCSENYNPAAEHAIHPLDPALGIEWPVDGEPILSARDAAAPTLAEAAAVGKLPHFTACRDHIATLRARKDS